MKFQALIYLAILVLLSSQSLQNEYLEAYDEQLAFNLTEYATASYCNIDAIIQWKCGILCDKHPEISDVHMMYNESLEALGFLAYNSERNEIVAVFRGTINFENVVSDIDARSTRYLICGLKCTVHTGFYKSFLNIRQQFWSAFDDLRAKHPDADIMITGHSLGGALAQHAAAELAFLGIRFELYTLGSPRVGDVDFVKWFLSIYKGYHYRITNDHDPVVHVPFKEFNFKHIPIEVYYYEDTRKEYKVCRDVMEDSTCSNKHLADFGMKDHVEYLGIPILNHIKACRNTTTVAK